MHCLIIGGSSGLGLSLATKLTRDYTVHITGRRENPHTNLQFHYLDLSKLETVPEDIQKLITDLPKIDLLIYAAGFFQEGTVTDLSLQQIDQMLAVGLTGAIHVTREILAKQGEIAEYIAITSTSQWTPRLYEPVYTAVKSGLGAYSNSLSLDPRVKKTLVAGPAGMATNFWEGADQDAHDTGKMLDPDWVADAILELRSEDYQYKFARILREPARVETQETRTHS